MCASEIQNLGIETPQEMQSPEGLTAPIPLVLPPSRDAVVRAMERFVKKDLSRHRNVLRWPTDASNSTVTYEMLKRPAMHETRMTFSPNGLDATRVAPRDSDWEEEAESVIVTLTYLSFVKTERINLDSKIDGEYILSSLKTNPCVEHAEFDEYTRIFCSVL